MKKFMIMALSLILTTAMLTACGCTANVGNTTSTTASTTTATTTAATTLPTTAPTTQPTVPSSLPPQATTHNTMPGVIDGTDGMDGTIEPDGGNGGMIGEGNAAHSRGRGMRRG